MDVIMTKSNGLPCTRCGTSEWYNDRSCKRCKLESARLRYPANADKRTESRRRWRQNNPEKVAKQMSRWRQENAEKLSEYSRRYWSENRDRRVANQNRRKTRQNNAGGSFTPEEFKALCDYYGNMCLSCKRTDAKLTADHIKPVSKGGTSNIDNIQPLCGKCNSGKKDKHIDYRPDAGPLRWLQAKLFG